MKLINIAMNNSTVQKLLKGHYYDMPEANLSHNFVLIDIDKHHGKWTCLMVGVDRASNTTKYICNLLIYLDGVDHNYGQGPAQVKIAMDNSTVLEYLGNHAHDVFPVGYYNYDEKRYTSYLVFYSGELVDLSSMPIGYNRSRSLYVATDINNQSVTSITDSADNPHN